MRQAFITLACGLALANTASAQSPEGTDATAQQMVRAAGMPLRDGALAPGMLTVRLVRGSFDGDLIGHTVEAQIAGQTTLREQTGAQGRAQFAHLPVGASVRASAVIDGERLQSDVIVMPPESGVRVLLVTGMGAPIAVPVEPLGPAPMTPVEPALAPAQAPTSLQSGIFIDSATLARITVISLTVFAFAGVGLQQWRRRRGRPRA